MKRREFITTMTAAAAGSLMAGCSSSSDTASVSPNYSISEQPPPESRPNILLVLVDELRFPTHFPAGINSADEYIARFMPNLYRHIWAGGVKFANYRVAAGACTPSRGVLVTGLYSQQTWVVNTISGDSPTGDPPPSLPTDFPTYGKMLKSLGYDTPYFGKFHVSANDPYDASECTTPTQDYLAPFGFRTYVCPDPAGTQGQGFTADPQVADQAISYLSALTGTGGPFCATVSFVNPHDYQYFWGGTQPDIYTQLFAQGGAKPLVAYDTSIQSEAAPPPVAGFPPVPPNWETQAEMAANKPSTQILFNEAQQALFGGAAFDRNRESFQLEPSPCADGLIKKGVAPFKFWERGQDSYIQIIGLVDTQIGRVMDALTNKAVLSNTVVIFTSDHGDYVGSHGLLAGKEGTCYEEALRVPLVVRDFTGRFAKDPETMRHQLSSSVDLTPMLVTLGNGGSTSWIQGDLATLYGTRHDMLSVVRDPGAPGREYAIYTTDEYVSPVLNFNRAPVHAVALLQGDAKLGTYNNWLPRTTRFEGRGRELEFYDYTTPQGRLELANQSGDPRVPPLLEELFNEIVPNEVRRPLPASLQQSQAANEQVYLNYVSVLDSLDPATVLENVHLMFGQDAKQ